MSVRYQASFTVTADSRAQLDEHRASIESHPKVVVASIVENGLTVTFDYDATVD